MPIDESNKQLFSTILNHCTRLVKDSSREGKHHSVEQNFCHHYPSEIRTREQFSDSVEINRHIFQIVSRKARILVHDTQLTDSRCECQDLPNNFSAENCSKCCVSYESIFRGFQSECKRISFTTAQTGFPAGLVFIRSHPKLTRCF